MITVAALTLGLQTPAVAAESVSGPPGVGQPVLPTGPQPEAVSERPDPVSAALAARLSSSRVEDLSARTEFGSTFANPDGSWTSELSTGPVRYRNEDGGWTDVDVTLVAEADGSIRSRAHPAGLRLASGGGDAAAAQDLIVLDDGETSVRFQWRGALPAPTLDGLRATYAEVMPGVDLVVEATRTGFEQYLIVKQRPADLTSLAVSMPLLLDGVTVGEAADGGLVFVNADGRTTATTPAPIMWDAPTDTRTGEPANKAGVSLDLSGGTGSPVLSVTPDFAFMEDPATVYPVTIDPSYGTNLYPTFDTFVQSGVTTDQSSATELALGPNSAGDVARSVLNLDMSPFAGKHILDADLMLRENYAPTCEPRSWQVARAEPASTATRWTNHQLYAVYATSTMTTGFSAACPVGWVQADITSLILQWATDRATAVAIGLKAGNESDTLSWKRFASGNSGGPYIPRITITYNSYPLVPTARVTGPPSNCVTGSSRPWVNSTTPTLGATLVDPDGHQLQGVFEARVPGGTTPVASGVSALVNSGSRGTYQVPSAQMFDGGDYSWRVQATDTTLSSPWSGWCEFSVDTTLPGTPLVTSAQWPRNVWTPSTSGSFSFSATDAVSYTTWLDEDARSSTTSGSVSRSGLASGWHVFHVIAVDRAGNTTQTDHGFGVGIGEISAPEDQAQTPAFTPLASDAPAGRDFVSYEYRRATSAVFTAVPPSDVRYTGTTSYLASWPASRTLGGKFPDLDWNAARTVRDAGGVDGLVQTRACFHAGPTDVAPLCSPHRSMTLTRTGFGATFATAPMGPATLSLVSGDLAFTAADAAVAGLAVARTFTTLIPTTETTGASGIFGPGWTASLPTYAGAADYRVTESLAAGFAVLNGPDGETLLYRTTSTTYPYVLYGDGAAADGSVLRKENSALYTLTDTDGTVTTFGSDLSGWRVTSVTAPGDPSATQYSYDTAGRTVRVLAPVESGVTCAPTLGAGCRALDLVYATTQTASTSSLGDYVGRLTRIDYTAFDPAAGGMASVAVAQYAYDDTGRLREVSDPRITPALKTAYTYGADGRVSTYTEPGLNPWSFFYDTAGRFSHVTRSDPANGNATQLAVYDLPLSGAGLPTLTAAVTGGWAQQEDLPRYGVAVFPASAVVRAGTGLIRSGSTGTWAAAATDWPYGQLTYLDANGRAVNSAAYGSGAWQVDATRYDRFGNVIWQLTPAARAQALAPTADTDPYVAAQTSSVQRADLLATRRTFSNDGIDLLSETGPAHQAMLWGGFAPTSVRSSTAYGYGEGPDPGTNYHLVRSAVQSPLTLLPYDEISVADVRTTSYGYDPVDGASRTGPTSGWVLRRPTAETVSGVNSFSNTRRTVYDANGRLVQTRLPSDPGGGTAATTVSVYYTAAANTTTPECGNMPHFAGWLCQTRPAVQPSGVTLPVTTFRYNAEGDAVEQVESSGPTTRTNTSSVVAGRVVSRGVTGTPTQGWFVPGLVLGGQTFGYSSTTGLPTTVTVGSGVITTGYDALGRVTSYTDADGSLATRTYDINGRIASRHDGKGSYAYTYDSPLEHRGLVTSVDIGLPAGTPDLFGAAYDANGQLVTLAYPNDLVATTRYDLTGQPVRLGYSKDGEEWLAFTAISNVFGQTVAAHSVHSEQTHRYDPLGRLTEVEDASAGRCERRSYTLDANSNRTRLDRAPIGASGCTVAVPATTRTHTYDTADRIVETDYLYDQLGQTRSVSTPDVHVPRPCCTNLAAHYHVNGMIATLVHNDNTHDYTLDPARRIRLMSETDSDGVMARTSLNHYPDSGDSPAWTADTQTYNNLNTWTRNILGPTGDLAAIQASDGSTTLQLANLHGDIVARVDIAASATGISAYTEHTEYGGLRDLNRYFNSPSRYEWLGTKQRNQDTMGAVILMGVRVYNPATGRFLQPDPIPGGSHNPYEYAGADPINNLDLDGRAKCGRFNVFCKTASKVGSALAKGGATALAGGKQWSSGAWRSLPSGTRIWQAGARVSRLAGRSLAGIGAGAGQFASDLYSGGMGVGRLAGRAAWAAAGGVAGYAAGAALIGASAGCAASVVCGVVVLVGAGYVGARAASAGSRATGFGGL